MKIFRLLTFVLFFKTLNVFAIANPASVHCQKIGGKSKIVKDKNGNQYGICIKNNKKCEEWKLFHNKCKF
jgi:putative hemolysin